MSAILVFIAGVPGDGAERTVGGTSQKTIRCSMMKHGIDLPVVTKGTARTPGYSMHGSFVLRHELDQATPKLRQMAALDTKLGEVHIIRTELDGGTSVDAETIKLGQVRLANVSMETLPKSDGTGCQDVPFETFELDYEEIVWDWRYAPEAEEGEPRPAASTVTGGWDTDDMVTISAIPAAAD